MNKKINRDMVRRRVLSVLSPIYQQARQYTITAFVMYSILDSINPILSAIYCKRKGEFADSLLVDIKGKTILISVSFNNPQLIEKQIGLCRKYLPFEEKIIIADNSSSIEKRKEIKDICVSTNTPYISLPKNIRKQPSLSHSVALNWIYKNIILVGKPSIFGFIDHDIFPYKNTSISSKMADVLMYGAKQSRKYVWYLWAGFCFFRPENLLDKKINFSTMAIASLKGIAEVDTGGGNWKSLYSKTKETEVLFAKDQIISEEKGEFIDDWFHARKASFKNEKDITDILRGIS